MPASIFEQSRMSLTMVRSVLPELTMAEVRSAWSGVRSVFSSSFAMPMMPFMGVRIS